MNLFLFSVLVLMAVLIYVLRTRFRALPQTVFDPRAAWLRAGVYFCACFLFSGLSGTLTRLVHDPVITAEQLSDPKWIVAAAGAFVLIYVAYWRIWARWTLCFDRKTYLFAQVGFGLLWGAATGQLLLSIYHLGTQWGLSGWGLWLFTFVVVGAWQGLWQDLYWDVYVVPEHDTPWSIKMKVMTTHIPNVVYCLTFLCIYENYLIYVLTQMFALTGAAVCMRYPPFWEKEQILAANTGPSVFGVPRCSGYVTDDPDPYQTDRERRKGI